jgi:hypothetical protein
MRRGACPFRSRREAKLVMYFLSNIFWGPASRLQKKEEENGAPIGAPTPLLGVLSTPGAPECNAVPQGHTATFASLDLRKAGAKTQDLGPRRRSD